MKYGMLIALLLAFVAGAGWSQDSPDKPQQVSVSVKIIEFQATKGVETGLSAYFKRRETVDWWGIVHTPKQGLLTADVTFPTTDATDGIIVFLDRLRLNEGDVEMLLQGLVDDNRAFILSQPKVMVMIGGTPNEIKTVQRIPYENTAVVGATTVQSTDFKDTGVTLNIAVPNIYDMDGNWQTSQDTYIQLTVSAEVSEEGQRLVVALADNTGSTTSTSNSISAPEFVNRSIKTMVYVNSGQVLVMGGLYNNTKSKTLTTVPWLKETEDVAVGLAERVIPGDSIESPLSSVFGHRDSTTTRRELVFLIKAEVWRPSYTVADENGMASSETENNASKKASPSDVISNVLTGISELPQEIGEGLKNKDSDDLGIDSQLGAKGKK